MPSPTPDQQAALTSSLAVYQQQTQTLREQLALYVARLWASLGSYRQQDIGPFLDQIVPVVSGAQQNMSALTAASLAQQRQILLGSAFAPAPVSASSVTGPAVRNGAAPSEVYQRPFHLVWRQLHDLPHEQGSIDAAIRAGENRATDLAMTDLQLAKTHTAQQVLAQDKHVVGYRRVLEGPYSCGLCCVAATLRYHKGTLLPIHPACDCAVAPIYGDEDPGPAISAAVNMNGQLVDLADVPDIHQRIADQFGTSSSSARVIPGSGQNPVSYRDVLITHQHGELGPVLAVRGRPFLGPSDLN